VIVTRQVAIAFLADVTVASITSRMRGLPTEVRLDHAHGLDHDNVVNCDTLFTVPKTVVGRVRGELDHVAAVHDIDWSGSAASSRATTVAIRATPARPVESSCGWAP